MTLSGAGDPERVPTKMISANLLPLLGTTIERGRGFSDAEDRPGAEGVAIVSTAFANRKFADVQPVGRTLQLDNRPYTIVGVLPPTFELFQPADVYVPFGPWASTLPDDRGWHPGIFPMARLKSGVSLEQARVEMETIALQLESEHRDSNTNVRVLVTRAQDQLVQNVRPALLMLLGAVALVLLIACANVANLLLARASSRQKEMAVRVALGASRARIIRQLIVESLVLACAGGAAGLLVATWGVSFLNGLTINGLPRASSIAVAWPVALFAFAVSVAHRYRLRPCAGAAGDQVRHPRVIERGRPRHIEQRSPSPHARSARRCRDRPCARPAGGRRPAAPQLFSPHPRVDRLQHRQSPGREPAAFSPHLPRQRRAHVGRGADRRENARAASASAMPR